MKAPTASLADFQSAANASACSRRQFLAGSVSAAVAVAGASLPFSAALHAAETGSARPRRPRIGCLSWNFHSLSAGANPEPAIDLIGGMGFEAIELIICHPNDIANYWTDAKVDQLKQQLERNKLVVSQFAMFQPVVEGLSSLKASERERSFDRFATGCRIAARLGAPLVNIVAPWARELSKPGNGYLPRFYDLSKPREGEKYRFEIAPGFNFEEVWQQWIGTVRALLERAKAHQLKFSLEHHTHCLIEDANAFLRLWDNIRDPNLGYNLDTGWTLLQREYPPVAIHKVGTRLVNLHVRDIDGLMRSFVPVGTGVMDFQAIGEALKQIGFQGALSIEQDRFQGMDMKEVCTRYLELMKKCLE